MTDGPPVAMVPEEKQIDDGLAPLHGGSRHRTADPLDPGSVEAMARTPQGRFLGLPYNWKRPTWAELRHTYWDRNERRVLLPKTYGWGLDINFAALFRRRPRP